MTNQFILYGTKDNEIYYIGNTNPVIWSSGIKEAKTYLIKYTAEYHVLRDYDNYQVISNLIKSKKLDALYIAEITDNYEEKGRVKLL